MDPSRHCSHSGSRALAHKAGFPYVPVGPMIPSALWILLLYVRLAPALHNRSERISVVLSHDATFKTAAPVRSLWSDNVSRLIRRQSGAHNVEPGTPALPEGAVAFVGTLGTVANTSTVPEKGSARGEVGEVVFAVRLRKLGLTSIAGIVGAYWVTVFRETSKESPGEDRSLLSAAPQALPWMVLSLILSIFNKWIFIPHLGRTQQSWQMETSFDEVQRQFFLLWHVQVGGRLPLSAHTFLLLVQSSSKVLGRVDCVLGGFLHGASEIAGESRCRASC